MNIVATVCCSVSFVLSNNVTFFLLKKNHVYVQCTCNTMIVSSYVGDSRQNLMIYWLNDWFDVGFLCCCLYFIVHLI